MDADYRWELFSLCSDCILKLSAVLPARDPAPVLLGVCVMFHCPPSSDYNAEDLGLPVQPTGWLLVLLSRIKNCIGAV